MVGAMRRKVGIPSWIGRLALGAVLLLAALSFRAAAAPPPETDPLVGQLLVAAPDLGDPRFDHAVILVVRHGAGGALGIIINNPVGERPLARLMAEIGHPDRSVKGSVRIFAGGPVQPEVGFIIHSTDYHRPETIAIDGKVAMTSSPEILRDIGHGRGPAKALVAFGYTGWGPGQLEAEMERNEWFTAPDDPALLFDMPRENVWDEAMARRTRSL